MTVRLNLRRLPLTTTLAVALAIAAAVEAQQLPKSVAIGSNPPGSLFYSLASGIAKIIRQSTPVQVQVQPYAGTSTFVPLFDSGELDLGVVNGVDMGMVYQGPKLKVGGKNRFPHVPSSRLIMLGSSKILALTPTTFISSAIKRFPTRWFTLC